MSASISKHPTGMRATIPAVQVRGECSCGAGRGSLSARLGPHGWPEKLRLGQCKLKTRPGGTPGPAVPCMLKKTQEEEKEEEEEGLFKADAVNDEEESLFRADAVN